MFMLTFVRTADAALASFRRGCERIMGRALIV